VQSTCSSWWILVSRPTISACCGSRQEYRCPSVLLPRISSGQYVRSLTQRGLAIAIAGHLCTSPSGVPRLNSRSSFTDMVVGGSTAAGFFAARPESGAQVGRLAGAGGGDDHIELADDACAAGAGR